MIWVLLKEEVRVFQHGLEDPFGHGETVDLPPAQGLQQGMIVQPVVEEDALDGYVRCQRPLDDGRAFEQAFVRATAAGGRGERPGLHDAVVFDRGDGLNLGHGWVPVGLRERMGTSIPYSGLVGKGRGGVLGFGVVGGVRDRC